MSVPFSTHIVFRHQASTHTVWQHLHSAGFVVRNLLLIPHEFSPSQKAERVGMAAELQPMLHCAKHRPWRYFLTGDESWFYYTTGHGHMWIPDGEDVSIRPRQTIASPKRILAVFWSRLGFVFVEILRKGFFLILGISAPTFSLQLCRIDHQRPLRIGLEEWCCISIMQPLTPPSARLII
jgi:hypothetical protein